MKTNSNSFAKIMNAFSGKHSLSNLFNDFLEITICAFSNQKKEDRYFELIKHYSKDELLNFSHALACLINEMGTMQDNLNDPLGDFFQEFITRGENGQFFTPFPVCQLMSSMTLSERTSNLHIADPAAGSGRTLLAAAQIAGPANFYYAADLDKRCAMMSAINLLLHGLEGEVACMNSISNEFFTGWKVTMYPFPHLIEISKEESYIILKDIQRKPDTPEAILPNFQGSGIQLQIF